MSKFTVAYIESGYAANVADRRRLHPLIEQGDQHGVEIRPYSSRLAADIILLRGRTHPISLYSEVLATQPRSRVVFDEPNDLAAIFEVSRPWKILRGLPYWFRGRAHPGDVLERFARNCDVVIQGSGAQNAAIARWVKRTHAIVDGLPKAEFDGTAKEHRFIPVPRVIWDGAAASFPQLEAIEPALAEAAKQVDFVLIVHTDRYLTSPSGKRLDVAERVARFGCRTEFREWRKETLKPSLLEADLALAVVDLSNRFNRVKPANKLISYWAYGLPVVASRTQAYEEVANPGEDVLLARDLMEWRTEIVRLVGDPNLRAKVGAAGYRKAWLDYSNERYAERYFSFLRRLCA